VYEPSSRAAYADILRERDVDIVHLHGMHDTAVEAVDVAKYVGVEAIVKTTPFGRVAEGTRDDIDLHLFPSKMALLRKLKLEHRELHDDNWNRDYRLQYYPLSVADISDRTTEDLRENIGVSQDALVVGKIGRSSAAKWSESSIDAFDRICTEEPETKILLVTPPEKIRNAISQRGLKSNVEYIEPIPPSEVGKFYNTIDVLAHASAIGESFGYVIAEAMAYETPVIVDSNPMRDNAQIELVNNGETGFVVGSPKAYADATLELLRSDEQRREFGTAARERATTLFDPKPIVDELETIYRVLYESDGDSEALEDELKPQREMMAEFAGEYRHRLHDLYGSESMKHQLERSTWRLCSEFLPVGRSKVYHGLQGPFKDI